MEFLANAQPLQGLAGGVLIGLAAAVMLLGNGRIAGVSGMLARASGISRGGAPWALAALFIAGLILGAALVDGAVLPVEAKFAPSPLLLIAGGLLVGFGTRLGSGCTSGHGVCGISRLSRRSIVATAVFMGAGMATVAVVNLLGGGWA